MVLFSVLFVFSAIKLICTVIEYRKAETLYTEAQKQYVSTIAPQSGEQKDETIKPGNNTGITIDFDALLATNPDVIGWIYCTDTPINYPVVQAEDNKAYLHTGLDGDYLRSGMIFADYRNRSIGLDRQFILYGHSMKNKTMFGSLLEYKKQAYYDAHPVLYYLTPDKEYRIELFAGCVMKVSDIIYQPRPGEKEFDAYLKSVRDSSTFQSEVSITAADSVVVLSTCSYEFDNARYVAFGKLVPIEN